MMMSVQFHTKGDLSRAKVDKIETICHTELVEVSYIFEK
jgi:hypothetical protein